MLQLATFQSDVTPPLGHPLCAGWYPPAKGDSRPAVRVGIDFSAGRSVADGFVRLGLG